ncbi:MAG: peroxiredoxin [Acidobacteriota bacterium]
MKSTLSVFAMLLFSVSAFSAVPMEGTAAPQFSLPNQEGKQTALEQFRGKWVVLYFYPKDYTSGCTLEAHNFQRDLAKYDQAGAVILGVSLDAVDSHKGFCEKEGLNFKILSDGDRVVTKKYGSLVSHLGINFAARNTFLIDPQGVIRKVYLKVNPSTHSEALLTELARQQVRK